MPHQSGGDHIHLPAGEYARFRSADTSGLGAVEAALSVAFTAVGIPSTIAVSATLVYRIAFYWLRIPMGAVAMKWLDRHNLI